MTNRIDGDAVPIEPKKVPPSPISSDDLVLEKAPVDASVQALSGRPAPDLSKFSETGSIEHLDDAALQEFKASIDVMADDLERLMGVIEGLSPEEAPRIDTLAQEQSKLLVEAAVKHMEAAENLVSASEGIMEFPLAGAEMAESFIAAPLEKIIGPFEELEKYTRSTVLGIQDAQLLLKIPEVLGKTAGLIYKRIVIKNAKAQVELMLKSGDPEAVAKAKKLKGWLELQDELVTKASLQLGLEVLAYSPKGVKAVLTTLDKFPALAAYGDLWASAVTGIVFNSYQVYKFRKVISTQEEWLAEIREAPLVEEPIVEGKAPESLRSEINQLLQKRKRGFDARKKGARAEFTQWIFAELLKNRNFTELLAVLKERGVHPDRLENPITSKEELQEALSVKGPQADQLLSQFVEHKTTVSKLTRQAIKSLSEKKQRVEKKMNQFELNKSKAALALSVLTFTVAIVLKTLALVGVITLPALAMSGVGAGLFALGLVIIAIGLIYYYKTHPSMFKEFVMGTQLRAAFYEIPASIDNFVVKIKEIKKIKGALKLMEFRAQAEELRGILEQSESVEAAKLPKRLRPLFGKLKVRASKKLEEAEIIEAKQRLEQIEKEAVDESEKRQAELERDIQRWTTRADKWKKRLEPLQRRIREAGAKDFARTAKLAEDRTGSAINIEQVIAEGLLNDPDLLDEDIQRILQKELGVDLEEIRSRPEKENIMRDTMEALQTFFAMDNSKIVAFIQEQQAKERYT